MVVVCMGGGGGGGGGGVQRVGQAHARLGQRVLVRGPDASGSATSLKQA